MMALAVADGPLPGNVVLFFGILAACFIAWFIFALPRGRSGDLFSYIERRHGGFKAWMFFLVLFALLIGIRIIVRWL